MIANPECQFYTLANLKISFCGVILLQALRLAQKIVAALADHNLDTWVDWNSIPKGEDWLQEIYRGIEEADAFLFLVNENSVISEPCNAEIEHAVKNGKRILPVFIASVENKNVYNVTDKFINKVSKDEINRRNFIFCRDEQDNFAQAIAEIHETIHTDYEWLQYHRSLQVKALVWQENQDKSRLLRGKELTEAEECLTETHEHALPTELQRSYVLNSRRNEDAQRRRLTISFGLGLVIVAFLAVFAWGQRNTALDETNAKGTALVDEEYARSTAVEEANLRATQQARANANATWALATHLGTLSAQELEGNPPLAFLLAVTAHRIQDAYASRDALLRARLLISESLLRVMWGHQQAITSITFSLDGKYIATGSWDKTAILWDAKSGQPIGNPLTGHQYFVSCLAFSPDGKILATGSWDKTIILWDVENMQPIGEPLKGHEDYVSGLVFSTDGKTLISSGWDAKIILWDINSKKPTKIFIGHENAINALAIDKTNSLLASGDDNGLIRLWDLEAGQQISEPIVASNGNAYGGGGGIQTLSFSPDGKWLASGDWHGNISLWEPNNLQKQPIVNFGFMSYEWVHSIDFSPDGRFLAASGGSRAFIWDLENEADRGIFAQIDDFQNMEMRAIAFSPDGKSLATGGNYSNVQLWSFESIQRTGESLKNESFASNNYAWAFSPDGRYLARPEGRNILLWDMRSENREETTLAGHVKNVTSLVFSPDGNQLWSASTDKTITMWDIETRQLIGDPLVGHSYSIENIVFSPQGNLVASTTWHKEIILWDVNTQQQLGVLNGQNGRELRMGWNFGAPVLNYGNALAFSPDGGLLASVGSSGDILLWDVVTMQLSATLLVEWTGTIESLAFSPDGRTIAAGVNKIMLWDIESYKPIRWPLEANRVILSLAFSEDGKNLATGSSDGTITLWDMDVHQMLGEPISVHSTYIPTIQFLENGDEITLAYPNENELVSYLKINFDKIALRLCEVAGRNLTREEWQLYTGDIIPYNAPCPNLTIPEE